MNAVVFQTGPGIEVGIILVVLFLNVVGLWKVFTKANYPGWASLIPIFNTYLLFKMGGNSGWWLLGLLVPLVNVLVLYKMFADVADAFGLGLGFALGLLFLNFVFVPLLGFGDYNYQGVPA